MVVYVGIEGGGINRASAMPFSSFVDRGSNNNIVGTAFGVDTSSSRRFSRVAKGTLDSLCVDLYPV